MTLGNIRDRVLLRTKTKSTSWGSTYADMALEANAANDHVLSLVRGRSDNFFPTPWSGSDISTGSIIPVFDALFHELIPLWIEYHYAVDNNPEQSTGIMEEIKVKEAQLVRFYGTRLYKIFTVTIAAPGVFSRPNHGLRAGQRVILSTSGALPTGLVVATWYFVISAGLGQDTFELSATREGTAITTSSTQSGTHYFATDNQTGGIRSSRESNK